MASDPNRPHFFSPVQPLLVSIVLLTLAFAPVHQFYLAWFGAAPWLICVGNCRSKKGAFFWSWIGGTFFFAANMWWLVWISLPGMIALMIYCGLYWGLAGLVIHGAKLLKPSFANVIGIAVVLAGLEWVRGHFITGLPLFYLGHSQTPFLAMCQVADFGGAYAVTFWVAAVNALAAMIWANRENLRRVVPAALGVGVMVIAVFIYGIFRLQQTPAMLSPGPVVTVIQANIPQSNSGEKGDTDDDRLKFHVDQTLAALQANSGNIDLAVWSETMLPPINHETIELMDRVAPSDHDAQSARRAHDMASQLARENHMGLIVGADYHADWTIRDDYWISRDRRNTTYLFDRDGNMNDSLGKRYDKIHLVPFGEFIPFKETLPFLYRLFISLGPKYYSDYELQSGDAAALTVFDLPYARGNSRFVTPICFEDIDANICAAMFRPSNNSEKRADFLVNVTNDGWFKANENAMHFQASIFRAIENRAPMVRSVNTGISGFIDSTGRTSHLLLPRTAGWSAQHLMLDSRVTLYTRCGDWFALACVAATIFIVLISMLGNKVAEQAS